MGNGPCVPIFADNVPVRYQHLPTPFPVHDDDCHAKTARTGASRLAIRRGLSNSTRIVFLSLQPHCGGTHTPSAPPCSATPFPELHQCQPSPPYDVPLTTPALPPTPYSPTQLPPIPHSTTLLLQMEYAPLVHGRDGHVSAAGHRRNGMFTLPKHSP